MEELHLLDIIHPTFYIIMQDIYVMTTIFKNEIDCLIILTVLIWYSTVVMIHSHNRYIEDGRVSPEYLSWRQHKLGRG